MPQTCFKTGTKARQCHPRYAMGACLRPGWQAGLLSAKKLKLKRTASSSNRRQKNCKPRVKEVSSILCDGHDAVVKNPSQEISWYKLSKELATKLSPSIVSLASFDGDKMHYKSTGIVVRNNSSSGACVLTSSALVSTSDTERWLMPALKIKLRLPNKEVVDGWIKHYDLPSRMVVIGARFFPDLREACLSNCMQVDPHAHLLAVKRCYYSGKLMKTYGKPIDTPLEVDIEGFMLSTCNITMDGSGGPLIDFDGNIVGLNDYHGQEVSRYVPANKILECLSNLWFSVEEKQNFNIDFESFSEEFTKDKSTQEFTKVEPIPTLIKDEHDHLSILDPWPSDDFTKEVNDILRSDGYPLPAYADGGMYLEGSFEEEFGTYMGSKCTRKVVLMNSKSVVALASFNDKGRHFACTGVFLDCNESTSTVLTSASLVRTTGDENKIIDNLRIEACLPNGKRLEGKLLHRNLSYNVAVVSIPIVSKNHAEISVEATQTEVVALGRAFKSGNLMATAGLVIGEQDKFDCRELMFSTCKITKAGIGGPLYDLDGNFIGMNFYDTEGTPYLPTSIIMKLLESFDAERAVAARITEKLIYSWPVPKPYWYYPSHHKQELVAKWILE
ncbi:hypothetical protein ACQ4PT_023190 [Festuca glaucescens]